MAPDDDRDKYRAGPDAARQFERTMTRVLSVTKTELTKRETAYKKSRQSTNRRTSKLPAK